MKLLFLDNQNVFDEALLVLKKGGVVMHPTETCYGLAADIFNKAALLHLYELKGREDKKPLSILCSDLDMAEKFAEFSSKAREIAERYWPGPLSIVLPRKKALPEFFNPGEEFVSIRVPGHDFSREMVRKFGGPVTTTSANLSGHLPFYNVEENVLQDFLGENDLVISGGQLPLNKPSTIIKIYGNNIAILRQGDLIIES